MREDQLSPEGKAVLKAAYALLEKTGDIINDEATTKEQLLSAYETHDVALKIINDLLHLKPASKLPRGKSFIVTATVTVEASTTV